MLLFVKGVPRCIDAAQLVPGDVVLLQEGQRVPADMRLIIANNLHVDEAILTGESTRQSVKTVARRPNQIYASWISGICSLKELMC